jgi:uncharacterized coiled-coil DUF342 family protein
MTRNVTDIIDGLRNTYRASQTSEVACEARALIAHIDAQAAEIKRLMAEISACAPYLRESIDGQIETPAQALDRLINEREGLVRMLADRAAEIERLRAAFYSIDRQLGHDDADDALRDEIDRILMGAK